MCAAAALAIAACSPAQVSAPVALPTIGPATGEPTPPAQLQAASTIDADVYKPSRTLPACPVGSPLKTGDTHASLKDALMTAQTYHKETQGIGLMVLKDGALIHSDFSDGMDGATQTVTASMMKSVVGLMIGIAVEKGHIGSVDDPVRLYLPEWADEPRGDITIKQTLTMSTGLTPIPLMEFLFAPDMNKAALTASLGNQPGSEFYYSNSVSQVLGTILDRQSKANGYDDFAEFLYRDLWCPLGNGEASLWTDIAGNTRAYAGLNAGIDDWARIGELIRNQGRANGLQIVPAGWIVEMTQSSDLNPRYGYHVWRAGGWKSKRAYNKDSPIGVPHSAPFAAQDTVFFDGFGGQRVYIIPSKGLTIVRVGAINLQYDDAIIPNVLAEAVK